jgi:hypothetical protein
LPDPSQLEATLDHIGQKALQYANGRFLFLYVLIAILILSVVKRILGPGFPSIMEILRGAFAILLILSGLIITITFVLTTRAQCVGMSEDSLTLVALVVLICSQGVGWHELKTIFLTRH